MVNPLLPETIRGINTRIYFITFLIIYGILLLFLIIDISLPEWLHQGQGKNEWHGNLFQIYEGSSNFKQKTFQETGDYFCDLKDITTTNWEQDLYQLLCNRFYALSFGGGVLVIGTIIVIICFSVVILGLLLTCTSTSCIILTVIFNSIGASLYTLLATIYLALSFADNDGDCELIYTMEIDKEKLEYTIQLKPACRDSGGNFIIFLVVVMPIISILLCVFKCCCLAVEMRRYAREQNIQMQPVQGIIVGGQANPQFMQPQPGFQPVYPPMQAPPNYPPAGYPPQQYPTQSGMPEPNAPYPSNFSSYPMAPQVYETPGEENPILYYGPDPSQGLYPAVDERQVHPTAEGEPKEGDTNQIQ